jgi:hypothetical protein
MINMRELPVIEMSPELVTGTKHGKSRTATFSLWTCVLYDDISSIPDETVSCCDSVVIASFVGTGYTAR